MKERKRGFEIVTAYLGRVEIPKRGTEKSAGYDLAAAEDIKIAPHEFAMVPTGVKAYMQKDEFLAIYIRSSVAVKEELVLMNQVGIIDADYYGNEKNEGQIFLPLLNLNNQEKIIRKGTRIAQGIFTQYLTADEDTPMEKERTGGFGSTGVNYTRAS